MLLVICDIHIHVFITMPWLKWLFTGLLQLRPRFAPGSVRVEFVVDKVELEQVYLMIPGFPCQYLPAVALRTHVSSGEWTIAVLVATVQICSLIPSTCSINYISLLLNLIQLFCNWHDNGSSKAHNFILWQPEISWGTYFTSVHYPNSSV